MIKKLDEFHQEINEAKNWPKGSIAKVSAKENLGQYRYRWGTFRPSQKSGAEGGLFYFKIENSGRKWIEGSILANNCLTNASPEEIKTVRVPSSALQDPGPEWVYIEKALPANLIGKSFYLDGNESGLMTISGKNAAVKEGEYEVEGFNFSLSSQLKEAVFFLKAKGREEEFYASLSSIQNFSKELSKDQKEVIAEWFARELGGAQIEVSDSNFKITHWMVKVPKSEGYPSEFTAGPFVNKKQAEDVLDAIKKQNKYSMFNPESAKITTSWNASSVNLDQLIDWAKTVGVKTTMKELLALRRGAVTAKKFGV